MKNLKELGIVTISNEDIYIYVDVDYTVLYSGYITNNGFVVLDEYIMDSDLSIDQNIQDFIDFLEEEAE